MQGIRSVVTMCAFAAAGVACGGPTEYQPLTSERVVIDVRGSALPVVRDGVEYRGYVEAFLVSAENEIGIRANEDGAYIGDTFIVNDGQEDKVLRCIRWQDDKENDFLSAVCSTYLAQAEPGRKISVRFNDFDVSTVVMPELAELTSPEEGSELSVSSGEDLELSWEPLGKRDKMGWELGLAADDAGSNACVDQTDWRLSDGSMEDTGTFVVPRDELPSDLPEGGCSSVLAFRRTRPGTLAQGIPDGGIVGRQTSYVHMRLTP